MKKEISVICHNISCNNRNGYGVAFGIYEEMAQNYNVTVNVVVIRELDIFRNDQGFIAPNIKMSIISPSRIISNDHSEWDYYRALADDEKLQSKLRTVTENSDFIFCDALYFVSLAKKTLPCKTIVYRSLDIEYDKAIYYYRYQKKYFYPKSNDEQFKAELLNAYDFENAACNDADLILALTAEDGARICELYGVAQEKIIHLPLCVNNAKLLKDYIPRKRIMGNTPACLVISNALLDDTEKLIKVATNMPNIEFHIIGKSGYYFEKYPNNVTIHGRISEEKKRQICSKCHFALNISYRNFGINVKMLDYFILGIPVLANLIGVRGYNVEEDKHYILADYETLESKIRDFCRLSDEKRNTLALRAFNHICKEYDYSKWLDKYKHQSGTAPMSGLIFGAGLIGKQAYSELTNMGWECCGFVDNDITRQGLSYCNKKIISLYSACDLIAHNPILKLVIAVGGKNLTDVLKQVVQYINTENIIIYDPFSSDCLLNLSELDSDKLLNCR